MMTARRLAISAIRIERLKSRTRDLLTHPAVQPDAPLLSPEDSRDLAVALRALHEDLAELDAAPAA